MLFQGGFTFTNFIADAFTIFMFILWFWLLIVVSGDLFRRHDVSGFAKVFWVIVHPVFLHRRVRISPHAGAWHGRAQSSASQ